MNNWVSQISQEEERCGGGSVAAQVEQRLQKWDRGTPPPGGLLEGSWREIQDKIKNSLEWNTVDYKLPRWSPVSEGLF